ncbi:protein kinase [Kitasatospora sp. NBC_00374]|uniref:protein kinase domain-containing protein n=1 Tax=Kitasatospora sp. NBC_00374 TaxID=2975964 RepID=UPI0030E4C24E
MAQTEQPGEGEPERDASADAGTPETFRSPESTAETAVFSANGGTPARGTAAPLGTVGDGRYRLTGKLGRGGMAEVFAAQDVRLGRTVAVKLLRGELAQDEVARLRFTREAHSVAALNHHSIVAVYDTGEEHHGEDSTPYIVMELVEGRTVRELLVDEEAPPVDQALIIIAGVLEALAYSHRHGIVHRDIKPANVIITTGGAVKVMDFGIARALTGAASTMTQTGMVMGTPQYLSPEQALGKAVDHRSDLYAAGCMLYELLALRPPFVGETPLAVVYQHVQDMPVPPSRVNRRVPPELDELVLRSLAKNPDDRFQSADEFRAHVQHALRQMHGSAGSGYAGGAAAAAAAAGLAAAASGNSGGHPGFDGAPSGGTSMTEPMGRIGPGDGTGQTEALPYQVTSPYQTPSQPYQGAGGPGNGGGTGYDGDGGDGPQRRRNPWGWALAAVAVLLAAGIGTALALSGGQQNENPPVVTPPVTVSSAPVTPEPSSGPVSPSATRTQNNTNTGTNTRPTEPSTGTPSSSPSASRSTSPSPSASASRSASASPSGTPSPSASASKSAQVSPPASPSTATQ